MIGSRVVRLASLVGALGIPAASALSAQVRGFDASYGLWWPDDSTAARSTTFTANFYHTLLGPFDYSLGFTHVDDGRSVDDHTFSGGEVGIGLGRDGAGPYVLGTVGLGIRHVSGEWDAAWSAGGGYALRPLRGLALGIEARYRVEDSDFAGFWRLHPADRRGLQVQARIAISLGGGGRAPAPARGPASAPRPAPPSDPPSSESITELARNRGASNDAARLTTDVVETALEVMGTPYRWGGEDANGFDCSGLIQYAYGQHGIILPRVSRDQMRMGAAVDKRLTALRPGDLLGFSVEGTSRITHIGLYVGADQFIHSSAGGVKLSSLTATDPDSRWWQQRWVSARRVVD